MCQYLEDWQNSVNQYFPNDQCGSEMLQIHAWVKDPFKGQDKPMDLKSPLIGFQIPLQLTFKNWTTC